MNQFQFRSYKTEFASIQEVLHCMQLLNQELAGTNMQNLIPFNETYQIITHTVAEHLGKNYFQEDWEMQRFDICFAKYYFDALHSFISHQSTDAAWQILFEASEKNKLLQVQYLALGVNAHVNNDLPFALQDTFINRTEYQDYTKINPLIVQKIPEVFHAIHERWHLDSFKNFALPLYRPICALIITNWRQNAWAEYLQLAASNQTRIQIKKSAAKTAREIMLNLMI